MFILLFGWTHPCRGSTPHTYSLKAERNDIHNFLRKPVPCGSQRHAHKITILCFYPCKKMRRETRSILMKPSALCNGQEASLPLCYPTKTFITPFSFCLMSSPCVLSEWMGEWELDESLGVIMSYLNPILNTMLRNSQHCLPVEAVKPWVSQSKCSHSLLSVSVCQFSLTPCTPAEIRETPDSHGLRGAYWARSKAEIIGKMKQSKIHSQGQVFCSQCRMKKTAKSGNQRLKQKVSSMCL